MMDSSFDSLLNKLIKENKNSKLSENPKVVSNIKEEDRIVVKALSQYGIEVESIYDLVNTNEKYPEIIDILMHILTSGVVKNNRIKEGVVRALTVKEAKGKVEKGLLESYSLLHLDEKNKAIGWAYGNAIEYLYSDKYIDVNEIIGLIKEKSNGRSRQMFVLALGKTKKHKEKVENILIDLTYDPDVSLHAVSALYKLKSKKAIPRMRELSKSPKTPIRKKAELFLKKVQE